MNTSSSPVAGLIASTLILLLIVGGLFLYFWRRDQRGTLRVQRLSITKSQRELENNLQVIIAELAQFCKDHPNQAQAYLVLGNLYRFVGDVQRGVVIHQNLMTDASLAGPMRDRVCIELANDLTTLGLEEQALQHLNAVQTRSPLFLVAQEKLLDIHFKHQDFDRAYQCMEEILRRKRTWRNRKRAAYMLALQAEKLVAAGHAPEARRHLQDALRIDADCILAMHVEGLIALANHDYDEAVEHYRKLLASNPSFAFLAIPKIEDAFYGKQSFMRFGELLQELSEKHIDNPFITYSLGKYLRKRKMYADARRALQKALDTNPSYLRARDELNQLNLEENKLDASVQEYGALLNDLKQHKAFVCSYCGAHYGRMEWTCSTCGRWETVQPDAYLFVGPKQMTIDAQPSQALHS